MDRLSALFIRRLRQMARRDQRRIALTNGLLELKIVEIGRHLARSYWPAFKTNALTGDLACDVAWLRDHFAALLIEHPAPSKSEQTAMTQDAPVLPVARRRRTAQGLGSKATEASDRARDAYAVAVVAAAGPDICIADMTIALLLSRAISAGPYRLPVVIDILSQPAPIISVISPVDGVEDALIRLTEASGVVPGGPYAGIDADVFSDENMWNYRNGEAKRLFVLYDGTALLRMNYASLKGRLARVLAQACAVLAVAETPEAVPPAIGLSSDLWLQIHRLDTALIQDLVEAFCGKAQADDHAGLIGKIDAAALTLHDVSLSLRPRRPILHALSVLSDLAACSREEKDDEAHAREHATRRKISQSPSKKSADADQSTVGTAEKSASSREKASGRNGMKTSGAEIIHPVKLTNDAETAVGQDSVLRIETLSGYGQARTWALNLKIDLDAYRENAVRWSELSTRLLLSGPPGTGKTTFARALGNSLQMPLVATSVSTWLEGGHLDTVLHRMSRTFTEASELAPAIVFIDEIDGIGKRVQSDRDYADYWNAVVNKLLELLDGAVKTEGIVVIGATNRPQQIDAAITRAGRLEKHIVIPKPNIDALAGILRHHLKGDVDALVAQANHTGEEAP